MNLRFRPHKKDILAVLFLLFITLAFFWRVPIQGKVLLPLDVLHTYEPWRSEVPGALGMQLWNPWRSDEVRLFFPFLTVVQQELRQGVIPFWNPHIAAGVPVQASGFYKVLYPPIAVLLLVLPVAYSMSLSIILHTFMGALFTYFFLREIGSGRFGCMIAAIVFAFGGYLVILMPSTAQFPTIIWLPLLLWSLERTLRRKNWRWAIIGGLVLTMQVLAGQLQVVLYSLTGLTFYAVYRTVMILFDTKDLKDSMQPLLHVAVVTLIGLGLAAFQILPTLELAAQGIRTEMAAVGATTGNFPGVLNEISPKTLLRVIIPDIFGSDLDKNIAPGFTHGVYTYFGLLPLFFIVASLFSPHRRLAWGLLGIALLVWLVMYSVPPFYQLFDMFYPSFKELGFHRAQMLTAMFGAAAVGLGADWLIRERPAAFIRKLIYGGLVGAALLVVVLVGVAYAAKYQQRFFWFVPSLDRLEPEPVYLLSSLLFGLLFLVAGICLLWLWAVNGIGRNTFGVMALVLIVIDLFLTHIDYLPAYEPKMLYPPTPSIIAMHELEAQNDQPFRIVSVNRLFWGDIATVFAFDDVQGYDSFLLKRYSDYVDLTEARADTNFRIAAFEARTSKFLDALNVKYIYAPRYKLTGGDWVSLLTQVESPQVESPHSYAGQPDEWTLKGWLQPVMLAPTPSKITFAGRLDYPTQIETAVAFAPEQWGQPDAGVIFEVTVQDASLLEPQIVLSQRLTTREAAGQEWQPVVIDLSEFTGREILVSFVTTAVDPATKWDAAWANPLLSDSSKVELLYYGPNSIYLNKNYLPRAWVVHQVTEVAPEDTEAAIVALSDPEFEPAQMAVIEGNLEQPVVPASGSETVTAVSRSSSSTIFQAQLSAPGLLVLSDIYYPGWNAYVDGEQRPLYATNVAMRGVFLPEGNHTVEFRYEPQTFRMGLYISAATVLILLGVVAGLWGYKKRKVR
jgi:hypothetical protein